jgi:hypothetical protein
MRLRAGSPDDECVFARYGWCAAIRGVEGGGLVDGLPVYNFSTDDGDVTMKCPTETIITDRREKELADLGFAPLVHCKGTDYAAFFSVQSCQKPKLYDTEVANANARLSAQLPYMMAVCRFAHYLKAMMRDKIGSFASRADTEAFLNRWISNYVTPDDTASHATKAKFPLREARVEVLEVPGKPGAYRAVTFLRPHFQLGRAFGLAAPGGRAAEVGPEVYLIWEFEDVVISSHAYSGPSTEVPTEAISFKFGRAKVHYRAVKEDGQPEGALSGGWDSRKNTTWA